MKLVLRQLPETVKGPARLKFLAPEAADALLALEKDSGGFTYTDFWRDPVGSLLAKRSRKTSQLPGYSAHGFGLALDIDLSVLDEKKISYEDLLYFMKKRGWVCHRRDGDYTLPEAEHFNFLGHLSERYLIACTLDPTTWQKAAEERIFEKYGQDFQLTVPQVQEKLALLGLYRGAFSGQVDLYTREAILAFQRTWDLTENGLPDSVLCRVLAVVTADIQTV